MVMTVHVDIVSAEASLYSGMVEMLFAPAVEGEVGIAPGHAALLTPLGPGEVRVRLPNNAGEETFYISGGILEVQPRHVTVLSDTAIRAADLDEAAALKARQDAEDKIKGRAAEMDLAKAQAELAEAIAQLQTITRLRRRGGRG